MVEKNGQGDAEKKNKPLKKTLTLGKIPIVKTTPEKDQVRQSFSHGRSKTVEVEVKKKGFSFGKRNSLEKGRDPFDTNLTENEMENRIKALQEAIKTQKEKDTEEKQEISIPNTEKFEEKTLVDSNSDQEIKEPENITPPKKEEPVLQERQKRNAPVVTPQPQKIQPIILRSSDYEIQKNDKKSSPSQPALKKSSSSVKEKKIEQEEEIFKKEKNGDLPTKTVKQEVGKPTISQKRSLPKKLDRNFLSRALDDESTERTLSLAALKRSRNKLKKQQDSSEEAIRVIREVHIPETISVSELANRMAIRASEVVKVLMKLGTMATINQTIDADTAELVCEEFGHKIKRISDSQVEEGLAGVDDSEENLISRPPVVTIMGHVDHGKTSLLDALRETDVVGGESGGITQHIGAYQVHLNNGKKITFIDTPGHAAFSEMRARGANITDIVILVVAADDGIKEQTREAINHAKAAKVPIIVAINKIDKPEANIEKVKGELLQHNLILEDYGGEILSVEVSAKEKIGLEKLEETILLQAEILDLKANPNRLAQGIVVEAKMDRGRGPVATVLIQKGTFKQGDIFVVGTEWGRARALINDHGERTDIALPGQPIEIIGCNGVPQAGDELIVVQTESKAREVSNYRLLKKKAQATISSSKTSMERLMSQISAGEKRHLPIVIKADVQGSVEAITNALLKIGTEEVSVRILHSGVGGINESDVTLAQASEGIIIGFNVRANVQARELAQKDKIDIRYYSIIYEIIDDIKKMMGGLLSPILQEKYLGCAEVRTLFNISKLGTIAGCYVTGGLIKRKSKARLLRDNVVIFEGSLKSLRRFKDEVKEVKESYECGISLENYNDIKVNDIIECYEIEEISRTI